MRLVSIFSIVLVLFLAVSCKNNSDDNGIPAPLIEPNKGQILIESNSSDGIYLDTANGLYLNRIDNTLRIHSSKYATPNWRYLDIKCSGVVPGSYNAMGSSVSYFEYTDSKNIVYSTTKLPSAVTINIVKIDTVNWTLSGSLTGILYEKNGSGNITVSKGKFNEIPYWEPYGGGGNTSYTNSFSYKVNNQTYSSSYGAFAKFGIILLRGNIGFDLGLDLPVVLEPGKSYDLASSNIGCSYIYTQLYQSSIIYNGKSGTVNITKHDFLHNIIKGTFNVTVVNSSDPNDTKVITGSFDTMY